MFIKLAHLVLVRQFKSVQQLLVMLTPTEKQSFAAVFDQVSSSGRSATFPDNIECCGNRNFEVSGDTRAALSFLTWLLLYMCDLLRHFGYGSSIVALMVYVSQNMKYLKWYSL